MAFFVSRANRAGRIPSEQYLNLAARPIQLDLALRPQCPGAGEVGKRKPQIQRLLTPEVVEVSAEDKTWLLDNAAALAEEGFLLEDFGGNSIAVQGLPAVLGSPNPASIVETFLSGEGCEEARPRANDVIVERFHSMACRAAVMSGDRLSPDEIQSLLEEAAKLEHPHNCPHGRPTVLTFTGGELERYFKRR